MVTYYGKFGPKLSMIMHPICDLLKQNEQFVWAKS